MAASKFVRVTVSKPDIRLPVDAQGELFLDGPNGCRVTAHATGSRLHVAAPGWSELRQLGPRSLMAKRRALKATIRALETLGLTLDLAVAGHRAVGLGAGVKPTLLARLLGLTSTDIRFSTVIEFLRSPATARPSGNR